ncbi:MAG: hypothetical protein H6707_21145 [Deltaproteobacteria bacterium]|nr:hypothetical protein [Deltaproteobacteria bacterium]
MNRVIGSLLVAALAVIGACSVLVDNKLEDKKVRADLGTQTDSSVPQDGAPQDGAPPDGPTLKAFVEPAAFYDNDSVNVRVELNNFTLVGPAAQAKPKEGYWRVYLDNVDPPRMLLDQETGHTSSFPGWEIFQIDSDATRHNYRLAFELVDATGVPLNPTVVEYVDLYRCGGTQDSDPRYSAVCKSGTACLPQNGCNDPFGGSGPSCAVSKCPTAPCLQLTFLSNARAQPGSNINLDLDVRVAATTSARVEVSLNGPHTGSGPNPSAVDTFLGTYNVSQPGTLKLNNVAIPTQMQTGPYMLQLRLLEGSNSTAIIAEHCWLLFIEN